jgi:hypothetical protein
MVRKRRFLLFLAFALLVTISNVNFSAQIPDTPAGISQLVESRGGRISCWGVVIKLGTSRFKENISPRQIEVREAKHGHDLVSTMIWRVEQSGRRLIIEFRPGMGDFGSGNRVEVRINRSALEEPIGSANEYFQWGIDTDVL